MNHLLISSIFIFISSIISALLIFMIPHKTHLKNVWCLFSLTVGLWGMGYTFGTLSVDSEVALFWIRTAKIITFFIPVFYLHFAILLVNCFKKFRIVIITTYTLALSLLASAALLPHYFIPDVTSKMSIEYFGNAGPIFSIYLLYFFIIVIIAHVILYKSYANADIVKKKQIKFVLIGTIIGFTGGSSSFLLYYDIYVYPYGMYLVPIYVLATTYAIVKHQLMDIKIAIKKSLVYTLLVTSIIFIYTLIILISERIFQGMIGYTSMYASILFASILALAIIPLRNILQAFVDNYFFKGSYIEIAQNYNYLKKEVTQTEKLKAIATLASGMAHEIKNPLTAIKTFSEHLPKKLDDKEFLIKFAKLVGNEVNRVDELVHQLLEFARPAPLSLINVDLHKLLNETLELQNNSFIEHRISVNKNFDTNMPLYINADSNQLKQAFLNLILNAIDAMPNGGSLTVGVRVQGLGVSEKSKKPTPYTLNPNPSIEITITDTGCGIDIESQKHIFEPFYSNKNHGTGLGLSITYGIIQEHKGNISMQSTINQGTNFMIELPINKDTFK